MFKTTATALCLMLGVATAQAQDATPTPAADAAQAAAPGAAEALPPNADCTFDKVFVCDASGGCAPSKELGTIDLPARFLVHYGEQVIASVSDDDLPHISPIQSIIGEGDTIIVDGNDHLSAWAIQLSRSKSEVTLTTLAGGKVLSAFGTCKPAP